MGCTQSDALNAFGLLRGMRLMIAVPPSRSYCVYCVVHPSALPFDYHKTNRAKCRRSQDKPNEMVTMTNRTRCARLEATRPSGGAPGGGLGAGSASMRERTEEGVANQRDEQMCTRVVLHLIVELVPSPSLRRDLFSLNAESSRISA